MTCSVVAPHAQPYCANPDAEVAVLLCHGFTGSVRSLQPWAEFLAGHGLRVSVPRLPGHGTHWRELAITEWTDWYAAVERELVLLQRECTQVFVAGLSMGGALALRLAEEHPVAGLVLVNPAIASDDPRFRVLGLLSRLTPSIRAIGNDIALPGAEEGAYERTPLRAASSMTRLWSLVVSDLGRVDCDVLLMTSAQDHVVDGATRRLLSAALPSVQHLGLANSFHVATLDHDAALLQQASLEFIRAHAPVEPPGAGRQPEPEGHS